MTEAQTKRVERFKREKTVKGVVEMTLGGVLIGWERSRDGRDMTTIIDENGRTLRTRPTYSYR